MAKICGSWLGSPDSVLNALSGAALDHRQPEDLSWLLELLRSTARSNPFNPGLEPPFGYLRDVTKKNTKSAQSQESEMDLGEVPRRGSQQSIGIFNISKKSFPKGFLNERRSAGSHVKTQTQGQKTRKLSRRPDIGEGTRSAEGSELSPIIDDEMIQQC